MSNSSEAVGHEQLIDAPQPTVELLARSLDLDWDRELSSNLPLSKMTVSARRSQVATIGAGDRRRDADCDRSRCASAGVRRTFLGNLRAVECFEEHVDPSDRFGFVEHRRVADAGDDYE